MAAERFAPGFRRFWVLAVDDAQMTQLLQELQTEVQRLRQRDADLIAQVGTFQLDLALALDCPVSSQSAEGALGRPEAEGAEDCWQQRFGKTWEIRWPSWEVPAVEDQGGSLATWEAFYVTYAKIWLGLRSVSSPSPRWVLKQLLEVKLMGSYYGIHDFRKELCGMPCWWQQNANLRHRHEQVTVAFRRTEESLAECHSCSSVPSEVGAWDSQSNQETAQGGRWDLFIRCGPGQYLTQSQMSQSSMRRKSDSIACLTVTSMSQALMYDSNTGAELDPKIFKAARMDELERMECRKIYVEVPIEEAQVAGKKVISLKWVDRNKGDAQRPNHRSRLVCREVKGVWEPPMRNTSRRFASFSAMPPLESRSKKGAPLLLKLLDISWAHLYGRADRDIYVELPEVTWANFWNVVIRDTWCGSDVGTELQHSVDQWRARKSTAFPTCFHIPTWWCSFFPGSPLPELIILKSPICTCYIHTPPEPRK